MQKLDEANARELVKIIEEGAPKLVTAVDQEVILVMGGTGEGKSTLINSLLGSKFIYRQNGDNGRTNLETLGPAYTSIGHALTSHTLYPQAFSYGPTVYRPNSLSEYEKLLNEWHTYANDGGIIFIYHPEQAKWQSGVLKTKKTRNLAASELRSYTLMPLPDNSTIVHKLDEITKGKSNCSINEKIALIKVFSRIEISIQHSAPSEIETNEICKNNRVIIVKEIDLKKIKIVKNADLFDLMDSLQDEEIVITKSRQKCVFAMKGRVESIDLPETYKEKFNKIIDSDYPDSNPDKQFLEYILTKYIYKDKEAPIRYIIYYRKNGSCTCALLDTKEDAGILQELRKEQISHDLELDQKQQLVRLIQEKLIVLGGAHYPLLPFDSDYYQYYYLDSDTNQYIYVDLPGFKENRSDASRLWTQISLEWSVRSAQKINSIFYVISHELATAQRGAGLKEVVDNLLSIFKIGKTFIKLMEPLYSIKTIKGSVSRKEKEQLLKDNLIFIIKQDNRYLIAFKNTFDRYQEVSIDENMQREFDHINFELKTPYFEKSILKNIFAMIKKNKGLIDEHIYRLEYHAQGWVLNYYQDWQYEFDDTKRPLLVKVLPDIKIRHNIHVEKIRDKNHYENLISSERSAVVNEDHVWIMAMTNENEARIFFKAQKNSEPNAKHRTISVPSTLVSGLNYLYRFFEVREFMIKEGGIGPVFDYGNDHSLKAIQNAVNEYQRKIFHNQMCSIHFLITKGDSTYLSLSREKKYSFFFEQFNEWVKLIRSEHSPNTEEDKRNQLRAEFVENIILNTPRLITLDDKSFKELKEKDKPPKFIYLVKKADRHYAIHYLDNGHFEECPVTDASFIDELDQISFSQESNLCIHYNLISKVNKLLAKRNPNSTIVLRRPFTIVDLFSSPAERSDLAALIQNLNEFKFPLFNFQNNQLYKHQFLETTYEIVGNHHTKLSFASYVNTVWTPALKKIRRRYNDFLFDEAKNFLTRVSEFLTDKLPDIILTYNYKLDTTKVRTFVKNKIEGFKTALMASHKKQKQMLTEFSAYNVINYFNSELIDDVFMLIHNENKAQIKDLAYQKLITMISDMIRGMISEMRVRFTERHKRQLMANRVNIKDISRLHQHIIRNIATEEKLDSPTILYHEKYLSGLNGIFSSSAPFIQRIKAYIFGEFIFNYEGVPYTDALIEARGYTSEESSRQYFPDKGIFFAKYSFNRAEIENTLSVMLLSIPQNMPQSRQYLRSLELQRTYCECLPFHLSIKIQRLSKSYSSIDKEDEQDIKDWRTILVLYDKKTCAIVYLSKARKIKTSMMPFKGRPSYLALIVNDLSSEQQSEISRGHMVALVRKEQEYYLYFKADNSTTDLNESGESLPPSPFTYIKITGNLFEKVTTLRFSNCDYTHDDLDIELNQVIKGNRGAVEVNTPIALFLKSFSKLKKLEADDRQVNHKINQYDADTHQFRITLNTLLINKIAYSLTSLSADPAIDSVESVVYTELRIKNLMSMIQPDFSTLYLLDSLLPYLQSLDGPSNLINETIALSARFKQYLMPQDFSKIPIQLNPVWGAKKTSSQQPDYEPLKPIRAGTAIKALFKTREEEVSSNWYGKLGWMNDQHPIHVSPTLSNHSRARRSSSLSSILEKIGSDLYAYLSNGKYIVPETRLAELPIKNKFTKNHALTNDLLAEINEGRDPPIEDGVYILSEEVEGYKNFAVLNGCLINDQPFNFLQCLEKGNLPEWILIDKHEVPLKGLMSILAASRLLGDTDVLHGKGENAGFIIEKDDNQRPIAIRAVKIDPGFAFNFKGPENLLFMSYHPDTPNDLTGDKRHLQYGHGTKPIFWNNLTERQQKQFISSLDLAISRLRNKEALKNIILRRELTETPKHKLQLPKVDSYIDDLLDNVNRQEAIYKQELDAARKLPRSRRFQSTFFTIPEVTEKLPLPYDLSSIGLKYEKVPGDGHCLFHAVGIYVGQDQQALRNLAARYLEEHWSEFSDFITLKENQTKESYLVALKENEWAEQIVIQVLMRCLNRPIIIIGPQGECLNPREVTEIFSGEPIFVHYNGHTHYDVYLLEENYSARDILAQLLSRREERPVSLV